MASAQPTDRHRSRRPAPLLDFALDLALRSSGQVRDLLVLSQGGEEGSFVVAGQACSPCSVGCPGQLPAERVDESLLQRSRGQPDPSCLAAVPGVEAQPVGVDKPERKGPLPHPRLHTLIKEPLLVRPDDRPGVASNYACGLEVVQQRGRNTRRVVDTTKPAAASVDEPRRQVTHVDHLGCQFGSVGDQNIAAWCARPGEPQRPVPSPVEYVAGTADEPDPGDQCPVRLKGLLDQLFARDFRLPVGVHALHDLTGQRWQ
jgi:hypothetical protein